MAVCIVEVEESHIPAITGIWRELMDFHRDLDGFYARRGDSEAVFETYVRQCMASDDALALAAVDDGEAVAYAIASKAERPPVFEVLAYGMITDLAVTAGRRGEGIGGRVVRGVIDWFAAKGIDRIELHVAQANAAGHSFWSKQGFKDYERVMFLQR